MTKETIKVVIVAKYEGLNGEGRVQFTNWHDAIMFSQTNLDKDVRLERKEEKVTIAA